MAEQITALWQEAEQHLREFERLARRTVEEAWLAGDALMRIKEQLPHGARTPALKERGIHPRQARRFIQLRNQYPEIGQIVRFDSVTAALTDKKAGKSGQEFSANVKGEVRGVVESFKSDDLVSAALYLMGRRLACHVNIGPLKDDSGAKAETKRRLAHLSDSVDELIDRTKTLDVEPD